MRILYGVVGEGMGHATRSRVVLEHLLSKGHEVRVVVSGRAHGFLQKVFAGRPGVSFEEIHGLHLTYEGNELDLSETVRTNLLEAPQGLLHNLEVYRRVVGEEFRPEAVISDFESWAYLYGLNHFLPVISIDNMQILNRCKHPDEVTDDKSFDFRLAKAAVKVKLPGAYHYLVTTFFFPPVRKRRTSLIPPILRPQILEARTEPGKHILVYQTAATANPDLIPTLRKLPYEFRVYGLGKEGQEGNVTLKPFSETGFVDDLRTARAVLANGGLSLMSEAVHLHVPMLAVPLQGQYEQELNARWLHHLRYGDWCERLTGDRVEAFLKDVDDYADAVARYPSRANSVLFECVDELLEDVAGDEPPPDRLKTHAPGQWFGAFSEEMADDTQVPALPRKPRF